MRNANCRGRAVSSAGGRTCGRAQALGFRLISLKPDWAMPCSSERNSRLLGNRGRSEHPRLCVKRFQNLYAALHACRTARKSPPSHTIQTPSDNRDAEPWIWESLASICKEYELIRSHFLSVGLLPTSQFFAQLSEFVETKQGYEKERWLNQVRPR